MADRRVVVRMGALTLAFSVSLAHAQRVDNVDVYVLADQLANEVELIREVTGRPYDDSPRLPVGGVTPAELYLQAQTLFRKANQLARELAHAERATPPPAPDGEVQPKDTYEVVRAALEQVLLVKRELTIETAVPLEQRDDPIAPTGVPAVERRFARSLARRFSGRGHGELQAGRLHADLQRTAPRRGTVLPDGAGPAEIRPQDRGSRHVD